MKKLFLLILIFISIESSGQRFPGVDSLKNYILRYIRNSTLEAFSNYRMQNVVYGLAETVDSLGHLDYVDTIFIGTGDTLKYKIGSTTFVVGKISGGGGSGTVTSIATTSPILGGTITTTGTLSLDTSSGKWRSENYYNTKYQPIGSYLTFNLINGATNLGSGAQVFKDTSVNKINLRSLTAGFGLDVTQNTNDIEYKADTLELATKARVKHVADSLGYIISGESVAWGTYAQRIALTPTTGQRFTQTNEIIGDYVYVNGGWEFQMPSSFIYKYEPGKGTAGLGTSISGSGSVAGLQQDRIDSVYSHYYQLSTGTTSTGKAHIASVSVGGQDFHGLPLDSNYVIVLSASVKVFTVQDATNNYLFRFGIGAGNTNDLPGYGLFFVSEFDSSVSAIRTVNRSNAGTSTFFATSTNMSSLDSQFVSFTIVANTTVARYYINGFFVSEQRTNIPDQNTNTLFTLGITKKAGTTARMMALRSMIAYITRKIN